MFTKKDNSSFVAISACDIPGGYIRVVPETTSEFTGKRDRKGKKIFEHHICRFFCDDDSRSTDYVVRWDGDKSGFITEAVNKQFDEVEILDEFFAERCEVIGDIFNTRVLEHD